VEKKKTPFSLPKPFFCFGPKGTKASQQEPNRRGERGAKAGVSAESKAQSLWFPVRLGSVYFRPKLPHGVLRIAEERVPVLVEPERKKVIKAASMMGTIIHRIFRRSSRETRRAKIPKPVITQTAYLIASKTAACGGKEMRAISGMAFLLEARKYLVENGMSADP